MVGCRVSVFLTETERPLCSCVLVFMVFKRCSQSGKWILFSKISHLSRMKGEKFGAKGEKFGAACPWASKPVDNYCKRL
jgi:hypothetical protein